MLTGAGSFFVSRGTISGGQGGAGGAGGDGIGGSGSGGNGTGGSGGNGGDGGVGVYIGGGGRSSFTNLGDVTGGTGGGTGAPGNGTPSGADPNAVGTPGVAGKGGLGGRGVAINNMGSISGGMSAGGVQAYAIEFIGGHNFVGGAGTINGGIDVAGTASFTPALPGSAVGTPLAINGPLVFAQTATYAIRISGAANDSTVVTGTASPNGGKVFVATPGAAPALGTRYTILTATGGVDGTFRPKVGSNLAFFTPTLSYDPTHVYLNSKYTFALAGLTLNEDRVLAAINVASHQALTGTVGRIFNAIDGVTKSQAAAVLDSLSGEGITAAQNVAHRSAQLFTSSIFDQTTFYNGGGTNNITLNEPQPTFVALAPERTLDAARAGQPVRELADLPASHVPPVFVAPARTWRAWATGFGGAEDIQGDRVIGTAAQNNSIVGGAVGIDYQLTPNYLVGVALGGTDGDFRVANRATSGSTSGGHVALYDIYSLGAWYGASSTSFSYFTNRTTRFVAGFGGLASETLRGDFDSHEFRSRLEFGRHFASLGALGTVTPFIALEIADLRSNGFGETPIGGQGLLRLNVNGQSAAEVPGFIGLRSRT